MPASVTVAAILAIFAVMAALMYTKRLPALLALPLMALAIAVVAGLSARDILEKVLTEGALRLHATYTTVIFGAILARFVDKTGIAENLIKRAAELAGDRPLAISVVMLVVVSLLFTVLGGLGAVIMVATIVLPVMLTVGLTPLAAGALFLFGLSLGGIFNPVNWQLYKDVLAIPQEQIIGFAVILGSIFFVVALFFLFMQLRVRRAYWAIDVAAAGETSRALPASAYLTPVIPVALLLGFSAYNRLAAPAQPFEFPIIPAMLCGLVYGVLSLGVRRRGAWPLTVFFIIAAAALVLWGPAQVQFLGLLLSRRLLLGVLALPALLTAALGWDQRTEMSNIISRATVEGIADVGPAVALMMGIGMVLTTMQHPQVSGAVGPLLAGIMPSSPLGYVVFFALLAPLALYRGPLNLFGMGAGLVGLMAAGGKLPALAIMAAIASVGQLQGVCDPTNTHNVWIANYLGVDTMTILKKTLPYVWALALAGLVVAGRLYVAGHP